MQGFFKKPRLLLIDAKLLRITQEPKDRSLNKNAAPMGQDHSPSDIVIGCEPVEELSMDMGEHVAASVAVGAWRLPE